MATPIATEITPKCIVIRDTGTSYAPVAPVNIPCQIAPEPNDYVAIDIIDHVVGEVSNGAINRETTPCISLYKKCKWILYLYFTYICVSLVIISYNDVMWKLYWIAYAITLMDIGVNIHVLVYYIVSIAQFVFCVTGSDKSDYGVI